MRNQCEEYGETKQTRESTYMPLTPLPSVAMTQRNPTKQEKWNSNTCPQEKIHNYVYSQKVS